MSVIERGGNAKWDPEANVIPDKLIRTGGKEELLEGPGPHACEKKQISAPGSEQTAKIVKSWKQGGKREEKGNVKREKTQSQHSGRLPLAD